MIYTVTFNPALDYVVEVENLILDSVNRTNAESMFYGGKGINVSNVLKNLGYNNMALGFVAGFTGNEIENGIRNLGIETDFIHLKEGFSRINIKVKSTKSGESRKETEINGQGPMIDDKSLDELLKKIERLKEGDILVLAGSIPNTLPEDIYERIMKKIEKKNIFTVVDATKDLLVSVLKYNPFLIKPNNYELGEIFGVKLKDGEEVIKYAKRLQEKGARNVLVSMAKEGALLVTQEGDIYRIGVPNGKVINSVGAGDSMVAGFIAGYLETKNFQYALKMGTAAGSGTAFSYGLATKEKVMELLETMK